MGSVEVGRGRSKVKGRMNGHIGRTKKAQTGPGNRVKKSGLRYLILAPLQTTRSGATSIF